MWLLLFLALLAVGLLSPVLCETDDERCVVLMNSCDQCVSNGCAWCPEGFCLGTTSALCSVSNASRSLAECGRTPQRRQSAAQCAANDAVDITVASEDIATCNGCLSDSCQLCVDLNTGYEICTDPSTSCDQGAYSLISSSIQPNFVVEIACVISYTTPMDHSGFLIANFDTFSVPTQNYIVFLLAYGVSIAIGQRYLVSYITIISFSVLPGRATITKVTFELGAVGNLTGSQVAGALAGAVNNGTSPIPIIGGISGPGVPTPSPSPSPSTTSGSGGNDLHLSKGALAGIIIGCIIGALILAAIIAYLLLRRQNNYMHPFRAPAAAYRP